MGIGLFVGNAYLTANITFEKVGITGNVAGKKGVGAFIGNVRSGSTVNFKDCYAKVNLIKGPNNTMYETASFVGMTAKNISFNNCYWSGTNESTKATGAFTNTNYSQLTNSYYNKDKFSLNSSAGLTTSQMQTKESYVGWDFENTWYMGEDGYPELKFE